MVLLLRNDAADRQTTRERCIYPLLVENLDLQQTGQPAGKENGLNDEWKTRQSLLSRVKDPNDEDAWEDFVRYYEKFIFHLLHQMKINTDDFDDMVQEILLKLWKSLRTYDREKAKFRTWLASVN